MLLAEKERRFSINPLKHLRQHPKQQEASRSDRPVRSLFWGNRVGKTEWGAQETARYSFGEHPFRVVVPPIEIWSACPSYDQQKETTQKKLERYLPKHRIVDVTYVKKNTWGEVILDNGSRINFKSYEQGREKFQGTGKRLIWFDEEPPHDIWEECFVRSEAGIPLDIILTMTPVNGMTWVYDDLYLPTDNNDVFVSTASWEDNPFLTEEQKAQMARGLNPQALQVRREGKFVKRVGLVCPWWERSTHLKGVTFNSDWQTTGAIDFGFSKPACFGLIGANYDDDLVLFDGFYGSGMTTPTIGKKIIDLKRAYGLSSLEIVADSAQAEDIQELNDYFEDQGENITVIPIKKASGTNKENWDEYRARKMQEYGQLNGKRVKIIVSDKLSWFDEKKGRHVNWFVQEVEGLKWDETVGAGGEPDQSARWDSKNPNHAIDMFSYYLVDHVDAPERPKENKPWEGKLPGTYIEPSPGSEDDEVSTNGWGRPESYDYD